VQDSSRFTTVQPVAPSGDSDTTMPDQPASIQSLDDVKQEACSGSGRAVQRPRRTLKLTMSVSKQAVASAANFFVEVKKLSTTKVTTETLSASQQVAPARGRKRGSSTQGEFVGPRFLMHVNNLRCSLNSCEERQEVH
jgi:hypothetical protein